MFTSSAGVAVPPPSSGRQEQDRERERTSRGGGGGSGDGGADGVAEEELRPRYVTRQEDAKEHAVAQAEASVLRAR